jgi:hypothetical protein
MVARVGVEPTTHGFSVDSKAIRVLVNQPLAALANPHSSLAQAQFGHTQSDLGTNFRSRCPPRIRQPSAVCALLPPRGDRASRWSGSSRSSRFKAPHRHSGKSRDWFQKKNGRWFQNWFQFRLMCRWASLIFRVSCPCLPDATWSGDTTSHVGHGCPRAAISQQSRNRPRSPRTSAPLRDHSAAARKALTSPVSAPAPWRWPTGLHSLLVTPAPSSTSRA